MHKAHLILILFLVSSGLSAQNGKSPWSPSHGAILDVKTIVKANMTGLALRNYGYYTERIVGKRVSIAVGVNTMPHGNVPYLDKFIDSEDITDIELGSFSIAPEVRFYLSKSGYGKGFYIAPYYKYERFNASNYVVEFIDENNIDQIIRLSGNLNTHSVGAAFGIQWLMGKRRNIVLDWTIIGAHYGGNKGHFDGNSTYALSENDRLEAKKIIEDNINSVKIGNSIPIKVESLEIGERSAQMDISSPWAFIRMALSVGFRF